MAKYKVNYQGGESRYSNAAVDYMIVKVPAVSYTHLAPAWKKVA